MRSIAASARPTAADQHGFTLIEVLVVMVVISVLAGISMVSYLGFRARSSRSAAASNVHTVLPALAAYHNDTGSYAGATLQILHDQYDLEVDAGTLSRYKISGLTDSAYCVQARVGDWYAWTTGPSQPIDAGTISHC
jgi:prepilin-type N-terminal cleavage/methylation domain-containing protein